MYFSPNGGKKRLSVSFSNVYEDDKRAAAYDKLEFPGTYFLAFRDLPALFIKHVRGSQALDFGCGAGRSTRFLKRLGFNTLGVDISEDMLKRARARDTDGRYLQVDEDGLGKLPESGFHLIFSAFTFDNIPSAEKKLFYLRELKKRLAPDGRFVNLVSAPEIYTHEWASFTTKDFPDNNRAMSGDSVKIVMTDVEDRRPVVDELFTDASYRDLYAQAGLQVIDMLKPLGKPDEPFDWVSETTVSPWTTYVLGIRG